MAEAAKGIMNPQITPEEVTEEVKQATAEVVEKAPSLASSKNTLYAMAATFLLALTFLVIGVSENPLSYAPVP